VIDLFDGEKTTLFWAGLIILSLAAIVLFSSFWSVRHFAVFSQGLEANVPPIVGGIVFVLIGLYMMKSGTEKNQDSI
jgi:xanthine/uracil permease